MKLKIALIYSHESSQWVSCQKIVANLLKAYTIQTSEYEIIHFDYGSETSPETWTSLKKLEEIKPELLIFLDHKPHPLALLELLFHLCAENYKPRLIFHLYGDFTLNLDKWQTLLELLKNRSLFFYAASNRQLMMLTEFIPKENLGLCPFPVDGEDFPISLETRSITRNVYNWQNDETVFLYTGRLSCQKQIHLLIPHFSNWRAKTKANARLVLIGEPDSLGKPFEDRNEWEGEYFQQIIEIVSNLDPEEQQRIEFHGFKSNSQLLNYYNAADCFINLSVHHDEDFGMSCAEALSTGLPMILSNWAGFASFKTQNLKSHVNLIPVHLTDQGPQLEIDAIADELSSFKPADQMTRLKIRELALEDLGIKSVKNIISYGLNMPCLFKGSKVFLQEAAYREKFFTKNTFYSHRERKYNDIYLKTYKHYV